MTSPEGHKHYGWWRIGTIDAPRGLTMEDGFGDADGKPLTDKTGQLRMRLFEHAGNIHPGFIHFIDKFTAERFHFLFSFAMATLFTPKHIDFVSKRVGNFTFSKQFYWLVDQSWVK